MDVNDLRVVVTVLSFVAFLGIVGWALARRNRPGFDAAAMLPFADADADADAERARPAGGEARR